MKKILFVMNTMGRAGAERALVALMNTFSPDEYEIYLKVLINRGEVFDEVPDFVKILNRHPDNRSVLSTGGKIALIKKVIFSFFYRLSGFRLLPFLIKNLTLQIKSGKIQLDKLLWRLIAKGTKAPNDEFDLAVAYLEGGSTYYVADKIHAKKKASFLHIDYEKAGYNKSLDLDTYDKIDRIFGVSNEAISSFKKIHPEQSKKVFLFRNLLDKTKINKLKDCKIPPDSPFMKSTAKYKLLTVGRLNYQKAYDIAIPALKLIRDSGIDADWFVLGEGPLKNELTELIQKNKLTEHFFLLGSVENPYPYYKNASIYVHATRFEGKSIAIEEAQILKKAIIASDCTGNREQIFNEKNGLLITLDSNEIFKAVTRLISNASEKELYEEASGKMNLSHSEDFVAFYELLK